MPLRRRPGGLEPSDQRAGLSEQPLTARAARMAADMIWDVKTTLSGAYLAGKNLAYSIFDPRLRTWPQALRMSRWRPAAPQKRHAFFQHGLRRAEMMDHFQGDIRADRILRTANPSVSRLACRTENPHHEHYRYCSKPYQMAEEIDYPEIQVRCTALPDISNREFLDISEIDQQQPATRS